MGSERLFAVRLVGWDGLGVWLVNACKSIVTDVRHRTLHLQCSSTHKASCWWIYQRPSRPGFCTLCYHVLQFAKCRWEAVQIRVEDFYWWGEGVRGILTELTVGLVVLSSLFIRQPRGNLKINQASAMQIHSSASFCIIRRYRPSALTSVLNTNKQAHTHWLNDWLTDWLNNQRNSQLTTYQIR